MVVLRADHKSKKSSRSVLLSYATTRNHFSIGLWCVTKSGFYTTTSDDKLSAWTKKKLQSTSESQTCTQRRLMVIVWWSAAHLTHYSYRNPSETITSEKYAQQINEMRGKLQCLQPALVNRMDLIVLHDNCKPTTNTSKGELIGLQSFASSTIFTWPLANQLPLLQASQQLFAGENASPIRRSQKMLSNGILNHGSSCYRNKPISHWQNCVDCNGSYFD